MSAFRTSRPRAHQLALALGGTALLAGCAALFGFEELRDSTTSEPDAESSQPDVTTPTLDGGSDGGSVPVCTALPEARDGAPLTGGLTRHFALRSLGFTSLPDGSPITASFGANLDGEVTHDLADSPCALWSEVLAAGDDRVRFLLDDACGIDNMASTIFPVTEANAADALFTRSTTAAIPLGAVGAVLSVTGLFETGDDATFLGAYWMPAHELTSGADASPEGCVVRGAEDAGGVAAEPRFTDRWCTDPRFLNADGDLSVIFGKARLSSRVLVADLADLYLPNVDPLAPKHFTYMHLRNVRLSARMVPADDGHVALVDGMIAGRWSTRDLHFQQAARGQDPSCRLGEAAGQGLSQLRSLCYARDLRGSADAGTCDSISVALAFTAYEVEGLGPARPAPAWEYGCTELSDAGVPATPDDFTQDCPSP